MTDLFRLDGRTVLITGAAGGIGSVLARGLGEAGSDLILVEKPGVVPDAALESGLASTGHRVHWYFQDLERADEVTAFVDKVWDECGPIDVLVSNAGTATMGRFNTVDYDQWRHVMAVDVDAPFLLGQRVAEHMISCGVKGRIIMVSSKNGLQAEPGLIAYNAAKGALELMAQTLAVELGEYGITVNTVCPGMVDTGFAGDFELDWERFTPYYGAHIPLENRFARTEEILGPVLFLASPAASYVTGHSLVVDGGVLANQVPRLQFLPHYRDRVTQATTPNDSGQ